MARDEAKERARERVVSRALKLLALAESPNKNEAAAARARFDEYTRDHGITDDEIRGARRKSEGTRRKSAGKTAADPWREEVALAIGRRRGCRPLRAKDFLVFEGEGATDAVSEYRRVIARIEEECDRYWLSHGHGDRFQIDRVYKPVFLTAAALAFGDPESIPRAGAPRHEVVALAERLSGHTSVAGCIHLVLESAVLDGALAGRGAASDLDRQVAWEVASQTPAEDKFVLASGFIFVFSDRPGNYATLFVGEEKLHHREDVSSFDDARKRYVWGFERGRRPVRRVVFATADREAVGEVEGKEIRLVARVARVHRDPSGEPMHVEGDGSWMRGVA